MHMCTAAMHALHLSLAVSPAPAPHLQVQEREAVVVASAAYDGIKLRHSLAHRKLGTTCMHGNRSGHALERKRQNQPIAGLCWHPYINKPQSHDTCDNTIMLAGCYWCRQHLAQV
jgi:hypothetical protein